MPGLTPLIVGLVWDALMGLGLGVQVVVVVVLLFIALELRRALKVGARFGGVLTSMVVYSIIAIVTIAVVIGMGWAEPDIGAFASDVGRFAGGLAEAIFDRLPTLNLG